MKTIVISGVIGTDVFPDNIRDQLDKAGGVDIRVEVSSPGGFVADGLEIYNLIKNYRGNKTTHLMGMAASMASYIVLAGDNVVAEDNAIFMLHNVWGIAIGDHRDLRKTANVQENMCKLLAKAYVKKSGKTDKEIRAMMDEETYLFGNEILDAGFVDEIVPANNGGAEDRGAAITMAQIQNKRWRVIMEEKQSVNDREKTAALINKMLKNERFDNVKHSAKKSQAKKRKYRAVSIFGDPAKQLSELSSAEKSSVEKIIKLF